MDLKVWTCSERHTDCLSRDPAAGQDPNKASQVLSQKEQERIKELESYFKRGIVAMPVYEHS